MSSKGIQGTLYLILLGAVLAVAALPAAAQTATRLARTYVTPTSARLVDYGKEIEFDGTISKLDGDIVGVVDSTGAETTVLIVPGTRIEGKGDGKKAHLMATGSTSASDRSALLLGLRVRVEGEGNCEGNLIAEVIKFRYDPCLCISRHGAPVTTTK